MNSETPTLIYIFDPMCGWCYAFSEVMQRIHKNYINRLNFEVLSGGMILGEQIFPIGRMADYIRTANKNVEEISGVYFGEKFISNILDPGTETLDSLTPSLATTSFKLLKPEMIVDFAHALQKAFFFEGKSLNEVDTYLELCNKFQLDGTLFLNLMRSEEVMQNTKGEFVLVSKWGVNGFPTLVMKKDNQAYLLSRGYINYESLKQIIDEMLNYSS